MPVVKLTRPEGPPEVHAGQVVQIIVPFPQISCGAVIGRRPVPVLAPVGVPERSTLPVVDELAQEGRLKVIEVPEGSPPHLHFRII